MQRPQADVSKDPLTRHGLVIQPSNTGQPTGGFLVRELLSEVTACLPRD